MPHEGNKVSWLKSDCKLHLPMTPPGTSRHIKKTKLASVHNTSEPLLHQQNALFFQFIKLKTITPSPFLCKKQMDGGQGADKLNN